MRRNRWFYIFIAVLVLAVSIFTLSAIADAGNFSGGSDYGGGGGWSGGSDWSGGSSDWGSSGGGGGIYFFGGGSGGSGGGGSVMIIVIGVLIFMAIAYSRNRKVASQSTVAGAPPRPTERLSPISSLLQKDPNFSEAVIKEKISNLYVQMQNAWQGKDFTTMRPHMTDALYNQFARQLDEMVRNGRTNFIERIAVLDVSVEGWAEDDVNDRLVATVSTRIVDYTVEDGSGRVISGSKTAEKFMVYRWELIRSKGMTTPERSGTGRDGTVEISCSSCGAPVEINQSAKCPYCGSIINAKDYDWSISAIQGISQRTAGR